MSPFPVASGPEGPISMPYIYSTDYQKKYFCILIGCYEWVFFPEVMLLKSDTIADSGTLPLMTPWAKSNDIITHEAYWN